MTRHEWFDFEEEVLAKLYSRIRTARLAELFGCSVAAVYHKANNLGLVKSEAFRTSAASGRVQLGSKIGAQTRFAKGATPWNKGKKGLQLGGKATQFKRGQRYGRAIRLYKPIGTERVSRDGYIERKVNDDMPLQRRWRAVHLLMWEEAHGPLPAGYAVAFKDGDKRNVLLENLELIPRADLMRRNSVHNLPPELKEVVDLKRYITRKINRLEKTRDE